MAASKNSSKSSTKKKGNELSPKNPLVDELRGTEFVKNPLIYSQIYGDFTPMQTNVMVELVNTLQNKINDYLAQRHYQEGRNLTLFSPEETNSGAVTFTIPIKDLGVSPNAYNDLEEACYRLLKLDMVYRTTDEQTGQESLVMTNIFSKIKFPTSDINKEGIRYGYAGGHRRTGMLEISMLSENVSKVFDMRRGYVEHVRHIVSYCHRKQSPRVYIYLSKWKHVGHKIVSFTDFKEYLGLLKYNAKRTEIVQNKYEKFSTFCTMVLNPIRDELNQLAAENRIDFSFDYEPRYLNGRKKGDPESLIFNIKLSGMGQARRDRSQGRQTMKDLERILVTEYHLTETDLASIRALIRDGMIQPLRKEIEALRARVDMYKPRSERAYVTQCLRNFLRSLAAKMEEEGATIVEEDSMEEIVESEDEKTKAPKLTEMDLNSWNLFTSMVRETIGDQLFDTYFVDSNIYSFENDTLVMTVPTKFVMQYIEEHLLPQVRDALEAAFGDGCRLQYLVQRPS